LRSYFYCIGCGCLALFILSALPLFAGVRPGRPRIFVNTDPAWYNCVDSLRARMLRPPYRAEYERLSMWRGRFSDVPRGRKPANVLPSYAIRWVIDPADTQAADTALAMLLAIGQDDGQSWHLSVMSIVYDWLYNYPGFSPQDKKLVRERMTSFMRDLVHRMRTDDDVFNNHSWYHLRAVYLGSLALMGEVPEAGEWLSFAESYWENNLRPAVELFEGGWHEGLSYSTRASFLNLGMWLEALESASLPRENRFAGLKENGDWLNRFTSFYAAQVLPDYTLARYGDVPEFVADNGWDNGRLFMIVARRYNNGLAAWILSRIQERSLDLLPLHIWYYLLWYDPGVTVTAPGEVLPESVRLCPETYDLFFMRSGWTEDATLVSFHAGDWFGSHDHLDVGHFSIFRKKALAIDAGVYAPMNTAHYINFANRTLAHNTLLIYDPEERFQAPAPQGLEVFNDGGQRVVVSLGGRSTQNNHNVGIWQANRLEGYHFERATVLDWFTGDTIDFVRADLTRAYNSDFFCAYGRDFKNRPKVESVVRSLVYVKPGTVVIYDRVTARDPRYKKTWILNTAFQPYLDKRDTFMAVNGPAKLAGRTFLPRETAREVWGSNEEPFRFAGLDMSHGLDLSLYPEVVPGGWIIRISPAGENLSDEFLHVLVAGDLQETAEDLLSGWRMLTASEAAVLAKGDLVLVFPQGTDEEFSFQIPEEMGFASVYVLGVGEDDPDKKFTVLVRCGTISEGLKADRGVLHFISPCMGEVVVLGR